MFPAASAPRGHLWRRLLAPLLLPLLLFAVITWQVVADGPLRRVDERLDGTARGGPLPRGVAEFLADLGDVSVAVPVLALALGYVAWRARRLPGRWAAPVAGAVTMALVPVLVVPLKELIGRTGPPGMAGDGYYPSGHTATAAVGYGAAVLLVLPWLAGTVIRRVLWAGLVVVNAGVGLGLVRRGYHWPLDVLASWCLSVALLTAMVMAVRYRRARPRRPDAS